MSDEESRDFDIWMNRVSVAGGPPEDFLDHASWFGAVRDRWFDAAEAEGLWEPGRDAGHPAKGYCRRSSDVLGHAQRADGLVVHFHLESDLEPRKFRARVCREPSPFRMATKWTDEQRLTWVEFTHGERCRGCGLGFVGGPEWKPILQRTPEEAELADLEQAEFRARHPDCASMTWRYGSRGVIHCCECCPPPPLSPEQSQRLARIVTDIVLRLEAQEAEVERRWRASADKAMPAVSARTVPNC
jgi:hypothetical protein